MRFGLVVIAGGLVFGAVGCSYEETADFAPDPASANVALALEIAKAQIAREDGEKLIWGWEDGVMMVGFMELYEITRDPELLEYARAWIDRNIERGYDFASSDTCPPAVTALALYNETGDEKYLAIVEESLTYMYEEATRTAEGGLNHLGTLELGDPPMSTLWVDSLFMFGEVILRWGEYAGDTTALDEYSFQYKVFRDSLQTSSGWFEHAYQWVVEPDPDVFWGRGNGWITASAYDYLRVRKLRGETDDEVAQSVARQVSAILATQDQATGMWWTGC